MAITCHDRALVQNIKCALLSRAVDLTPKFAHFLKFCFFFGGDVRIQQLSLMGFANHPDSKFLLERFEVARKRVKILFAIKFHGHGLMAGRLNIGIAFAKA